MPFRFEFRSAILVALSVVLAPLVMAKGPVITSPEKAAEQDPDFAVQGEYEGLLETNGGVVFGLQVVALGDGRFAARGFQGGLPAAEWGTGPQTKYDAVERSADGTITFAGVENKAVWRNGKFQVMSGDQEVGVLKKVARQSETLGAKPPSGATVLFNGSAVDAWDNAVLQGDVMTFDAENRRGTTSKQKFGSCSLHIEFRLPYQPGDRGQGRGNSGLYMQGRYEVQMLDSFGLSGEDNECGGIYKISKPILNMCYPPLSWQTYDVDFTAAEYDGDKVVANPRITVRHNGVAIQKDVELPEATAGAMMEPGPDDGPIFLQDHGNPVVYRNIWLVPR